MTVLDLIKAALRKIRVYASGETPSAEDSADCLQALNMLLGQWNNEGLALYSDTNFDGTVTASTASYTVGEDYTLSSVTGTWRLGKYVYGNTSTAVGKLIAKGDLNHYTIRRISGTFAAGETILEWDTPTAIGLGAAQGVLSVVPAWQTSRPGKIDVAYITIDGVDYPLYVITNDEYQRIEDKTETSSIVGKILLDTAYPNATVRLYPVPSESATCRISYRSPIGEIVSLTETVSLPGGYEQALVYALAVQVAPEFGKDAGAIIGQAIESKAAIKRTNWRPSYLGCDDGLVNTSRSDIFIGE